MSVISPEQPLDLGRPIAQHRKRIYWGCVVSGAVILLTCIVMVGLKIWPMEPTSTIAALAICPPMFIPLFAAWWDAPGENRTKLAKSYEFLLVWFVLSALGSEIVWELPWLIADLFGLMNFTWNDGWGFYWSFYGIADTRYLKSDPSLWAIEFAAVLGGISMCIQFLRLRRPNIDDQSRIKALWWGLGTVCFMDCVCLVYYVSEFRAGCVHFEQGFWPSVSKLIVMNFPWIVAPSICIPLCVKMLTALIRRDAIVSTGQPELASAGR